MLTIKVPKSQYDKLVRIKMDSDLNNLDCLVELRTDNMTHLVKETEEGYVIDVFDVEGELVNSMTVWNDDLEINEE